MYPNIESVKWGLNYRVGYRKSDGQAVRIYGDSAHGYTVAGYYHKTLKAVSQRLETL